MSERSKFYAWQDGQTHSIVELGKYGWSSSANLIVTNNGVVWSAMIGRPHSIPNGAHAYGRSQGARLPPEYRLPLVWARKATKGKAEGEVVTTPAGKLLQSVVKRYGASRGSVEYVGFTPAIAKRSAHSLDDITTIIGRAIERCHAVWNWHPINLQVCFHNSGNAFGLAYAPGKGEHKISLHVRLLESYDDRSVWRVIVHEFCHHYRDEQFPRSRDAHDSVFCRELGLVDAEVAEVGAKACSTFVDAEDQSLVAAVRARKKVVEPIWSPDAGEMLLTRNRGSGQYKMVWRPTGSNRWTITRIATAESTIVEIAKRFAPREYVNVKVVTDDSFYSPLGAKRPANLLELFDFFLRGWPRRLVNLREYLASVIDATKGTPL